MMRMKTFVRLGGMAVLAGSLAACGGGNGNNGPDPGPSPTTTPTSTPTSTPTTTPTGTPSPTTFQEQISPTFAAVFNAPATGDPIDPNDSSVPALAPASDPINDGN